VINNSISELLLVPLLLSLLQLSKHFCDVSFEKVRWVTLIVVTVSASSLHARE
jgi:hypothetical protein